MTGRERHAGKPGVGRWAAVLLLAVAWVGPARGAASIGRNFTGTRLFTASTEYFVPADTMGAVGPAHIVELLNGVYRVYDKATGQPLFTSSLDDFWTAAGSTFLDYTFDPRITYDPFSRRFYAASVDRKASANSILLAVSRSDNPLDGWTGFTIDSDPADLRWADFPMLGYNGQWVYLAANMIGIGGTGANNSTSVFTVSKADLLAPTPSLSSLSRFDTVQAITSRSPHPVYDMDQNLEPAALLSADHQFVLRSNLDGPPASPALTFGGLTQVAFYDFGPDAEQPGPKQNLDNIDIRLNSAAMLRNGVFYGVQGVTDPATGHAAVRWFMIEAQTNNLLDEGLITDDQLDLIYPSIAVNEMGDVVVGFTGSSESVYASALAAIGHSDGTTLTFEPDLLLLKAGVDDYEIVRGGRNRWGDYSATVLDPDDPLRFWTFQLWADHPTLHPDRGELFDRWAVQITEIIVPEPSCLWLMMMLCTPGGWCMRRKTRRA